MSNVKYMTRVCEDSNVKWISDVHSCAYDSAEVAPGEDLDEYVFVIMVELYNCYV